MNKPLFITFEGIDGSGKSTQAEMFYRYLREHGADSIFLREPTSSQWGKSIRAALAHDRAPRLEQMMELFLKDREFDVKTNIMPALQKGVTVVMDRYYHSNAAYQGAMGFPPLEIIDLNLRNRFPIPDRVYLIDVDTEVSMERIRKRSDGVSDSFEKADFLRAVREIYLSLADESFFVINGSDSIESVHAKIVEDYTAGFIRPKN